MKFSRGFTLIELLVVIAIIGLLSSIVLASLSTARSKAKDAAIKEDAHQLADVMALNYNDYGSYCQLQIGWVTASGVTCANFSGTYAPQAEAICQNIYDNAAENNWGAPGAYKIYAGPTTVGCGTTYTFMVFLNDGKWFCTGSSGANGEYTAYGDPGGSPPQPGCYANP